MRKIKVLFSTLFIVLILGCQTNDRVSKNYLVGNWTVTDASGAEEVTILGKNITINSEDFPELMFSKDKFYMDGKVVGDYHFSSIDSVLHVNTNENPEALKLVINHSNEFATEDNMGLKLTYTRLLE